VQARALLPWARDEESKKLFMMLHLFVRDAKVCARSGTNRAMAQGGIEAGLLKEKRERELEAFEAEEAKRVRVDTDDD
jgi:hypothetical protein